MLEILHGKEYFKWKKGVIKKKDGKWVNPVTGEENARFNPKMGDDEETLAYEKEIKQITKVIKDANPEMYQEVTKYKAYNEDGTFMSIFLQEWERRLLEHAYTFLKEKGVIDGDLNDCVLCFDGIMVLKKNVEDVQTLINELQEYLKLHTGFNISFDDKDLIKHDYKRALRGIQKTEGDRTIYQKENET